MQIPQETVTEAKQKQSTGKEKEIVTKKTVKTGMINFANPVDLEKEAETDKRVN